MAVTYGFYNSLNKDRMYNAEQMSSIFNGIITDGVFSTIGDALMTVAGTGMQVIVKPGRAWFNSTWTLNDAQLPLDVPAADVSLTRIDAVILEVNSAISARANSIKVLKGTPSANPTKPTLSATETLHQYALAYITVAAGVTSITAANIEINVGKTSCPFITSVLQQTDITDLFNQWESEFTAWFENVQSQLSGDIAANLQRQIDENYANTLKDSTKTVFGLSADAVPDDAFNMLNAMAKKNFNTLRYTEFLTSGTWVAPSNLGNNGDIWLFGIGGGGGGGYASGGGSGYMALRRKNVTPGNSYTVLIGAGGIKSDGTSNSGAGGASSFGGASFFQVLGGGGGNGYCGGDGGAGGGGWAGSLPDNPEAPYTGGNGQLCGGGGGGCGGSTTTTMPRSGGNGGKFGGGGGAGHSTYNSRTEVLYRTTGGNGGTFGGNGGGGGLRGSNGYAGLNGTHGEMPFVFSILQAHLTGCDSIGGNAGTHGSGDANGAAGGGGGGYGSHGGNGPGPYGVSQTRGGGGGGGGFFANGGNGGNYAAGGGGGFFGNGGDGSNSNDGRTAGGGGGYFGHGGDYANTPTRGAGGAGGRNGSAQAGASGVIAIWYFVEDEEAPNET